MTVKVIILSLMTPNHNIKCSKQNQIKVKFNHALPAWKAKADWTSRNWNSHGKTKPFNTLLIYCSKLPIWCHFCHKVEVEQGLTSHETH